MYDKDNIYDIQWRLEQIYTMAKDLRNDTYCASGIENYGENSIDRTERVLRNIHKQMEAIETMLIEMQ